MEKILQQILEGQAETTKELKMLSEGQTQIAQRLDNIEGNLAENTRFILALSQDVARTQRKTSTP